jgi:hypothetical protein
VKSVLCVCGGYVLCVWVLFSNETLNLSFLKIENAKLIAKYYTRREIVGSGEGGGECIEFH